LAKAAADAFFGEDDRGDITGIVKGHAVFIYFHVDPLELDGLVTSG
jgi:hypothetical protein